MSESSPIRRLLRPESVAVVGGRQAEAVIRQCDKIGFRGQVWPVNPKRSEMVGRRCFATIQDLPAAPDATFVAVGREATIDVVEALAQRGSGGAVCYASGFAEVGEEGFALQQKLQSVTGDLAVIGPNCYGLLNYLDGVALWPDEQGGKATKRGVAILTQSGNICLNLSMQQRALPVAYLISMGNQAGVTIPQLIDSLLDDERVTAIGIHLEGLSDVVAFSQVAHKALHRRVPIVVIKSGVSELASQVSLSHTSSLAGSDMLYDTLFARMGIVRVYSIPQFLETLKFLTVVGPLPNASLASISCSGGEAGLVADAAAALGLTMPPLHEAQRQTLFDVLGEKVALSNPLDYHTYIWGNEEAQYRCFSAMLLGDQAVTLKILDYPRPDVCDPTTWHWTARAFARALKDNQAKGAVVATMPENLPVATGEALIEAGVAPMMGLEETLIAIRGAALVYQRQQAADGILPLQQQLSADFAPPSATLTEAQSKALLAQYGIPVPRSKLCTVANAAQVASEIGFPVVAKLSSDTIIHKSDVGGVYLNLHIAAEVELAVQQMLEAGLGEHFLIETMVEEPLVELILGVKRDAQFGLVLLIGAGGILVELFKDSATLLFPIQYFEVEAALERLNIAPLLNGFRGQPKANKQAIVDAVMSLAQFAQEYADQLWEIDVNPLFVLPDRVIAVDAVVRMRS
ncbi:MAG: acetate--CoA ligase family protein [Caldilineaceae bacterium]